MKKSIYIIVLIIFPALLFSQKLTCTTSVVNMPSTISIPGENNHFYPHIRAYFTFGPNKYNKTITGIEFNYTIEDAFGDQLHSGSQKWGITIYPNKKSGSRYLSWDSIDYLGGDEKIYNKIYNVASTAHISINITRIAFKDGSVIYL